MTSKATIRGTTEAWESGKLGLSKAHARKAPAELSAAVDEALGLQAISIRLPQSTIKAFKHLAAIYDVGYQPLMRDALCRFVEAEMKQLLAGAAEVRVRDERSITKSKGQAIEKPPATKRAA